MARAVRPGGHLVIVTECLVGRHVLDLPLVQFGIRLGTLGRKAQAARPNKRVIDAFTPAEIERNVVRPSGMELVQPLESRISPESWDNLIRWTGDGDLHPRSGRPYPHVLLQAHGSPWTSAFLALRKSA